MSLDSHNINGHILGRLCLRACRNLETENVRTADFISVDANEGMFNLIRGHSSQRTDSFSQLFNVY